MTYLSYRFALFLGLGLLAYYILPKRNQWKILLVLSTAFCIFESRYGFLLIALSVFVTWQGGRAIEKNQENEKKSNINLFICSFVNIFILALYKTFFFLHEGEIIYVVGIAFYTLMSIGYLVDIKRQAIRSQENILKFALFITYFPHIVIGPVSRYSDISETLYSEKKWDLENFVCGIRRMIWGAFKKMVIANRIMPIVNEISGDLKTYNGSYVLMLMLLYAVQLYADFSGGIDIALGVSDLFGIRLRENFVRPYFSKSLAEYWRRWHVSMSSWFRDYMFYPISTSSFMQKISKRIRKTNRKLARKLPVYISLIIVWFATGLWHGIGLNFILWGLLNGVLLIIFNEAGERISFNQVPGYKYLAVMGTIMLTSALKLFDCYDGAKAFLAFASVFTDFDPNVFWDGSLLLAGANIFDYFVIAVGCVMILISSLAARSVSVSERIDSLPVFGRVLLWGSLVIICIVFGVYGIGYEKADFIYNRL